MIGRSEIIIRVDQKTALAAIRTFTGIPFRLEKIATINSINIINDTTSTSPTATIKALETVKSPIVLLLGGESKNLPVKQLAETVNKRANKIVLLAGSGTDEVKPLLDKNKIIAEFADQEKAITAALEVAPSGSTVLFSPGFTSFGMFNNEFERGEAFNQSITKLRQ